MNPLTPPAFKIIRRSITVQIDGGEFDLVCQTGGSQVTVEDPAGRSLAATAKQFGELARLVAAMVAGREVT